MGPLTPLLIDLAVLTLLVARQVRVRPAGGGRLPLVLAVAGVAELASYLRVHPATAGVYVFLAASLTAAAVLGAARAVTVRLWRAGGQMMRQGTWLTVVLWLVSAGLHFALAAWLPEAGAAAAAALLFLGATLGAQQVVLAARARTLVTGPGLPR